MNIAPKLDLKVPPSSTSPFKFFKGNFPTSVMVLTAHPQHVINVINFIKNKNKKKCNLI